MGIPLKKKTMKSFEVTLEKIGKKKDKEAVILYERKGRYYKPKHLRGDNLRPPKFTVGKTLNQMLNTLFEKYGYFVALEKVDGKIVRKGR